MEKERKIDGRSIDHQTLQVIRQKAVKAVGQGFSVKDVANIFEVSQKAVYGWLSLFAAGGQNALLAKPIPGAPHKITTEHADSKSKCNRQLVN